MECTCLYNQIISGRTLQRQSLVVSWASSYILTADNEVFSRRGKNVHGCRHPNKLNIMIQMNTNCDDVNTKTHTNVYNNKNGREWFFESTNKTAAFYYTHVSGDRIWIDDLSIHYRQLGFFSLWKWASPLKWNGKMWEWCYFIWDYCEQRVHISK